MLFFPPSGVQGGAREPHLPRAPPPQLRPLARNFPKISTPGMKTQKVLGQGEGRQELERGRRSCPPSRLPPTPAARASRPRAPRPGDSWQSRAGPDTKPINPGGAGAGGRPPGLPFRSSPPPAPSLGPSPHLVRHPRPSPSHPSPHKRNSPNPPSPRTDQTCP